MKVSTSGLRQDSPSRPLLQALISYQGITDGAGAASGLTIVCGDLVNEPSYDGLLLKMRSGAAAGQVKPIYVQAGNTLTFATPWTNAAGAVAQITAGTLFDILSISAGSSGPGPSPTEGLSYYGVVDDVPGANQFTIGSLAGLGAGKFADAVNPYVVFVLRSAGGISGAPQGELLPVTAYATATGIFTTGAFTVGVGVGDEILILNPAVAATLGGGGGVAVAGYPDGIVYFNDTDGGAGVAWPVGTADNPSNDEASTLAIAVAYGLRKISVYGRAAAFVVPGAMVGYEFTGQGMYSAMDTIDLNGQDVATSVFRRLNIIGAMGGAAALASFYDCTMPTPTNIDGILQRCYIQQMGLAAAAVVDADGCCALQGPATITLGTPAPCNLYGWKGDLVLAGQTGGTTNIYALGGTITINVSCNGGTINIYGSAIITDNSAGGCTVNDYTNNMVPAADAATNVQLRDVVGNKTDTALTAYTAADSMMRYVKGLLDQATTLTTRLSAVRAGYLDELAAANLPADVDAILTDTGTTLPGLLATIQADLDNPDQYKADVAALALEATLTAIKGAGWTDENLTTIDALIDAIKAVTDQLPNGGALNDLATLEARLTAVRAGYLDELAAANLPTDIAALATSQGRMLFVMDFWSLSQEEVALTVAAGDKALPSVTVADLPAGATIVRAIAMFKFRMVENHTYAGVNSLDGAQEIQVAGSVDAINFVDTQFTLAEGAREGGDVIIGIIDIAATVTANGAYAFHWDLAKALQTGINFNDVQVGIRIWYSV